MQSTHAIQLNCRIDNKVQPNRIWCKFDQPSNYYSSLYFQIHFLSDSMNVFLWLFFSNAFLIHTQGPPTVWSKLKCCRKTQCRSWAKQWWDRASLASGSAGRRWMESDVWWPAAPSVMLKTAASKVNLFIQRETEIERRTERERRETREREREGERVRQTHRKTDRGWRRGDRH